MNELILVTMYIQTILAILLGYALGKGKLNTETLEDFKTQIKRKLNTAPVGAVNRPSAKQLATWNDPKKKAEEDEMLRVLKDIPELQPKG